MKLFLEERLLALKVNISNIDPPGHKHMQKSPVFIGSILTSVDGKQLKMLGVKISGKMIYSQFKTLQKIMNYQEKF